MGWAGGNFRTEAGGQSGDESRGKKFSHHLQQQAPAGLTLFAIILMIKMWGILAEKVTSYRNSALQVSLQP